MAPTQTRKRKSDEMATPEAVTPTGTPALKRMKITQLQKQALIDNLQLEISERARRLRAQYAIQCKDLRSRIERRIHRIPIAMRNMTMAELLTQHEETKKPAPKPAVKVQNRPLPPPPPAMSIPRLPSPVRQQPQVQPLKSRKRKTSEIHIASDKENDIEPTTSAPEVLPVTKNAKRAKTATTKTTRTTSRTQKTRGSKEPVGILSPRSHNSRTLPRSPIKDISSNHPMSPTKVQSTTSYIARPVSPLKLNSPLKTAATAATSAISASVHGMLESARQHANNATKSTRGAVASKEKAISRTNTRAASAQSNHSNATDTSTNSSSTVVTKQKRTRAPAAAGRMGPPTTTAKGKSTTAAAAAKVKIAETSVTNVKTGTTAVLKSASTSTKKAIGVPVTTEPAAGKRVLRKRN